MSEVDDLYGKLLSRPPSIRLLEVLPATDPSHGISCKLRRYALEYTPAYKALSYAWKEHRGVQQAGGELDARREGRIEITNVPTPRNSFPVSLSLVLAIKRQRSTRNSVFLWIDAICINQADDNERTDQVTLMGIIYQRASEVIIWLGEREPEDELGEWLQGQYLLAVQYFDWGVPRRAEELVDRYITRYCMLRDEYHERDEYHGLNNPKTDIYGAFCLLWLLSQGSDSTHVVFYHDTSVFSDDTSITTQSFTRALTEGRFRADWAAQVTKGLRAIMARSWVGQYLDLLTVC
ncbi:hypothetical protein E8E11_008344 [Didymella keratinophila]|nr:hypothetical protein E8E11_008344 [Didymella keratinophila]